MTAAVFLWRLTLLWRPALCGFQHFAASGAFTASVARGRIAP